jgi:hypothetical protein
MQQRKHPGTGDGKERHRLGEAVDAGPPILPHQVKHCADESAGMSDADPPDEIDDGESPGDGNIDAPDSYAAKKKVGDCSGEDHDQQKGDGKSELPWQAGFLIEDDRGDFVGHGGVIVPGRQDG